MSLFKKSCVPIGLLVLLASGLVALPSGGQHPRVSVEALMTRKLEASQKILEGLAREDYAMISREAQTLSLLSCDVSWNVLQTPDYIRLSVEFRKAAEQIQKGAQDKNLDAGGLGYVKLTMTCIDCHRHVRSVSRE